MASFSGSASLPAIPRNLLKEYGIQLGAKLAPTFELMLSTSLGQEEKREHSFKVTKQVTLGTAKIMRRLKAGDFDVDDLLNSASVDINSLIDNSEDSIREGRVSQVIEKFAEAKIFRSFFLTGLLVPPSAVPMCNDDEYVGAVLGFAQELARYAVGCAIENDTTSISICRSLLVELNAKMLEFDFRNGQLRRKYDGLKYALKKLEDITYELSLVGEVDEHPFKKIRLENGESLICVPELGTVVTYHYHSYILD
jgi:predicted translin family RNA/ssDNA-binding protein